MTDIFIIIVKVGLKSGSCENVILFSVWNKCRQRNRNFRIHTTVQNELHISCRKKSPKIVITKELRVARYIFFLNS